MRTRSALPTLLLHAALAVTTIAGLAPAWAQHVERVHAEPTGLQALAARVSGRVQAMPDGGVQRQWPGTYAEAAFSGSEVYFRVGPGDVSLRLRLDDGAPIALVKPAPGLYRVLASRSDAPHRLRIDVANESQAGPTRFGGFFLAAGASPAALPTRPRQIEFIGDSHTVGYGNTSPTRECTEAQVWEFTDTTVGVAPRVAARHDADYQVQAISGRGVVRNFNGFGADVLPSAYPFVLHDKATLASDPGWRPRAIVVNLGTNDFATPLHEGEKWKQRDQLQADFVAGYASFVLGLHQQQPQAYLLLWAAGSDDSELVTQVRKVVERVRQSGSVAIGFVPVPALDMSGCHYHPSVADDERIAQALSRHLQAHLPGLGTAVAAAAPGGAEAQPAPPAAAKREGKPTGQLINDWTTATTWYVYGAAQRNEAMAKGGPKDYPMTRVTVNAKGNPWDVGATSPIAKPIKAGDTVLVAVYLRAPDLQEGETTPVSYVGLNENSPPYTAIAKGSANVTNQWKVYYASGVAGKAFTAEQVVAGLQLAAARHVVDLGPVLVYDFGPGVDPAALPR
jgi:lysophospholipase L1-like esterase